VRDRTYDYIEKIKVIGCMTGRRQFDQQLDLSIVGNTFGEIISKEIRPMAQLLPPVPEKFAEKEHTRVVQMNSRRMGIEAVTHDYATRFVTEMGEGYGVTEPGVVWRDPLLNERPKAWSFLISINIFAATFLKPNFDPQVFKKVLAQDFLFAGVRIIDPSLRHSVCKTSCRQHLFALRKELDKNVDELAYHYWNFYNLCIGAYLWGAQKTDSFFLRCGLMPSNF